MSEAQFLSQYLLPKNMLSSSLEEFGFSPAWELYLWVIVVFLTLSNTIYYALASRISQARGDNVKWLWVGLFESDDLKNDL